MKTVKCTRCDGTGSIYYYGVVDGEDKHESCIDCDHGMVTVVRVVNFSHPLTESDIKKIKLEAEADIRELKARGLAKSKAAVVTVEQVLVPCHLDLSRDIMDQAIELAESAFQADLIVPPALGAAAFVLGAITAQDHPPSPRGFIVTRRREGVMPPAYEIGQIVW